MSSDNAIYLPDLQTPDCVEQLDYEQILLEMKQQFNGYQPLLLDTNQKAVIRSAQLVEDATGERYWRIPADESQGLFYLELESDPVVRQLEVAAYRELMARQRNNEACHAVMPAYAEGTDLDHIARRYYGLTRHILTPATDRTPAVMETDKAFRRRLSLAYDKRTTAGSEESYIAHALDADSRVKDVDAHSPRPTENIITILSHDNNGVADADLLLVVESYISALHRRPNAELVTYRSAEIIEYQIRASIKFNNGPSPEPLLEQAKARITQWASDNFMLGRDVTDSAIKAQLHIHDLMPGMHSVVLDMNLPIIVQPHQAARCTTIEVINGGMDV